MPVLVDVASTARSGLVQFYCPACRGPHMISVAPGGWEFNGDYERPTLSPSVLVQSGHFAPGHKGDCWCTHNAKNPDEPPVFTCGVCHSFVGDGWIQFLDDCTHSMAGSKVALPQYPRRGA